MTEEVALALQACKDAKATLYNVLMRAYPTDSQWRYRDIVVRILSPTVAGMLWVQRLTDTLKYYSCFEVDPRDLSPVNHAPEVS